MRRVLFFAVLDQGFHGQVLRGVMRHARTRPWAVTLSCWAYSDAIDAIETIRPDGVILNALQRPWLEHLARRGIPWVNIGPQTDTTPTISTDTRRVAAVAVEHLLSRRFSRFAFYGPPGIVFSDAREIAFRAELACRGFDCLSAGDLWGARAAEWVASLPKPIAVLAASDEQAFCLIQCCRAAGVRVPEELAVMGVDNSALGLMCAPTLTTIAMPSDQIGEQAAVLLDRLMDGEPAPAAPVLLPPVGVIARRSTDSTGDLESDLAQVIRYIRDNARRRLSVSDVLQAVPVSRRGLERRFKAELGRGVYDEIRAARLEEVKHLLLSTDLPLSVIADETGFGTAANLSMSFRKITGMTAGEYRRQFCPQDVA